MSKLPRRQGTRSNHQGLTQEKVRKTLEVAADNLKTARSNLGLLRERLRREGFDLP